MVLILDHSITLTYIGEYELIKGLRTDVVRHYFDMPSTSILEPQDSDDTRFRIGGVNIEVVTQNDTSASKGKLSIKLEGENRGVEAFFRQELAYVVSQWKENKVDMEIEAFARNL